jgi:hypothetical protein
VSTREIDDYGMPAFKLRGKTIAGFAALKKSSELTGFEPVSPP